MRAAIRVATLAAVLVLAGCERKPSATYTPHAGSLALSRDDALLYAVDTDNGFVAVVDTAAHQKVAEGKVGRARRRASRAACWAPPAPTTGAASSPRCAISWTPRCASAWAAGGGQHHDGAAARLHRRAARRGQPSPARRGAPCLHDGSAGSLKERLLLTRASERHGRTSGLTDAELDDLVEYLLSL